jgi:hypothetical protein
MRPTLCPSFYLWENLEAQFECHVTCVRVQITLGSPICGGVFPQLMLGCRWYALLLACSVNKQLVLCGALDVTGRRLVAVAWRLVVEVSWRHCCLKDECCSSLRLARWGVLFSEARWNQRVSWSGWFPLKSSPTCSYRWLLYDLQNVPREHAKCTAGTARANRSETSWQLTEASSTYISVVVLRRTQYRNRS